MNDNGSSNKNDYKGSSNDGMNAEGINSQAYPTPKGREHDHIQQESLRHQHPTESDKQTMLMNSRGGNKAFEEEELHKQQQNLNGGDMPMNEECKETFLLFAIEQ